MFALSQRVPVSCATALDVPLEMLGLETDLNHAPVRYCSRSTPMRSKRSTATFLRFIACWFTSR